MPTILSLACPMCGAAPVEIDISDDQFDSLESGEFIQSVLPDVEEEFRERFISGVCPKCWTAFDDDEEGDIGVEPMTILEDPTKEDLVMQIMDNPADFLVDTMKKGPTEEDEEAVALAAQVAAIYMLMGQGLPYNDAADIILDQDCNLNVSLTEDGMLVIDMDLDVELGERPDGVNLDDED